MVFNSKTRRKSVDSLENNQKYRINKGNMLFW